MGNVTPPLPPLFSSPAVLSVFDEIDTILHSASKLDILDHTENRNIASVEYYTDSY